jgi:hypothetical protein
MACADATPLIFVQLLDLPFELARFTPCCKRIEHQLRRRLAAAPSLHEVEAARDLAWGHCPDIRWRIVCADQSVDRFR